MQKIITVSIDIKQLPPSDAAFAINEVDSLNEWLAMGWEIEEWDFLRDGNADGKILLLVILNDDAKYDGYDDEIDDEFNFGDEDDEDEDENFKGENNKLN